MYSLRVSPHPPREHSVCAFAWRPSRRLLGRLRLKWNDYIKMALKELR
jgi:hypothetical protein